MIRPQTCPICDKELPFDAAQQSPLFPFCSTRCKQIDLYRWTEGHYAIVETLTPERLMDHLGEDDPDADAPA
jgi:endogenous inhibitor of DNA gyrase (YacG/DUF329 family)